MKKTARKYATPREFAKLGILAESQVRKRIHQGKCPGIQMGQGFLINVDALIAMLEKESMEAVTQ